MKTIHQCVVIDAGQDSVEFLPRDQLARFFPDVKDPDLTRAVVEDIWVTQVVSEREDVVAVRLPAGLDGMCRVHDWTGRPCLAVALPLTACGPQGEPAPAGKIALDALLETPQYKSVPAPGHGLRTIDVDSPLFARLTGATMPKEVDEDTYTSLVQTHVLHDTLVDLTAPLPLQVVTRASPQGAAAGGGVVILMIAVTMGLVSRPRR